MAKEVLIWEDLEMMSLKDREQYEKDIKGMMLDEGFSEEEITDNDIYDRIYDDNQFSWECEVDNFNIPSNRIINFAHCGTWNGWSWHCFQIGNNVNKIMYSPMRCNTTLKLYADRYNVKGLEYHHDSRFAGGGNEYLFREIKDEFVGREDEVLERCYNQETGELLMDKVKYYTKSLRPYVKKVYGV